MKKVLAFLMISLLLLAGISQAKLLKSKHDMPHQFHVDLGDTNGHAACTFCHHMITQKEKPLRPLWGGPPEGDASGPDANTGFSIYDEEHLSLVCLSCHDYSVAPSFDVRSGFNHPWDIDYQKTRYVRLASEDPSLKDLPAYDSEQEGVQGFITGAIYPMKRGFMHCTTCHDPHESAPTGPQFIRHGQDILYRSEMCRDCHSV